MNRHVLSVRQHSCIVLRHLCFTWAGMSLFSATTLLLVLRHFYYVSKHISVQYEDTSALCYNTSVTWAGTSLFSTVPYLRVPIVLCPSHSLLLVYISKHLYDKNPNNEQEESIRNQFSSVMYLWVHSVQDLYSELLWEI